VRSDGRLVSTAYDELTYRIIGCAMEVHRSLGPGYRELTYQRALEMRLDECGLRYEAQRAFEVRDALAEDALLGYYVPDFVVEATVVVELKALSALVNTHLAQMIGYLVVSKCPVGLLINFGDGSLRFRRVLPPRGPPAQSPVATSSRFTRHRRPPPAAKAPFEALSASGSVQSVPDPPRHPLPATLAASARPNPLNPLRNPWPPPLPAARRRTPRLQAAGACRPSRRGRVAPPRRRASPPARRWRIARPRR